MYNSEYVSERLHHFVGRNAHDDEERYKLLTQEILGKCSLRHHPFTDGGSNFGYTTILENEEWHGSLLHEMQGKQNQRLLFPNIICFADIPEDRLELHMNKYSKFGLSFDKKFAAERGARPVMYFPWWSDQEFASIHGASALNQLTSRLREVVEGEVNLPENFKRDFFLQFLAYIKPFEVGLPIEDEGNYYLEREWRVIGYVNFCLDDVKGVFLPPKFADRFQKEFPSLTVKIVE